MIRFMAKPHVVQKYGLRRQTGASMVEFMVVSPFLLFFGLGIMQMGLVITQSLCSIMQRLRQPEPVL